MKLFYHIKEAIKSYKEKRIINRLRNEFIFFGHDTACMTDEDIKNGMLNIARVFNSFGATKEEAEKAFKALI